MGGRSILRGGWPFVVCGAAWGVGGVVLSDGGLAARVVVRGRFGRVTV